jgi:acyl-CoA reductase-like NAD-dependent aldehyde dehydrogenase
MPVHNPATGEEIGFTPFSTEAEVDDAVAGDILARGGGRSAGADYHD